MKKISFLLTILFLAVGSAAAQKAFYSKESKVGFSYPATLKLTKPDKNTPADDKGFTPIASFDIPEKAYPKSNFRDGSASVSVGSVTLDKCKQLPASTDSGLAEKVRHVKVGNNWFYTSEEMDGGAGTFGDTKYYRTFHGSKCYEVNIEVTYFNVKTYEKKVRDVSGIAVKSLESIVRTLHF